MAILYLTEQGAYATKRKGRIVVTKKGETITTIRASDLSEIVVVGNVVLGPSLIRFAFSKRIPVTFLTWRGVYSGRLDTRPLGDVELRLLQYDRVRDPEYALEVAKVVVKSKIEQQHRLLRFRNYRLRSSALSEVVHDLRMLERRCSKAGSHAELMGMEGAAAKRYFEGFAMCFSNPDLTFRGRTRRPPLDEVNAMLSFGYTLLAHIVAGAVARTALDPMLGFLHSTEYGRPSLVLDLMEPLRTPVVDSLVLRLVNTRAFTKEDFERPETREDPREMWTMGEEGVVSKDESDGMEQQDRDTAVYFTHEAVRSFITLFERHVHRRRFPSPQGPLPLREAVVAMAREMASALREGRMPRLIRRVQERT